jgi:DnaJ-class molecular chaperone
MKNKNAYGDEYVTLEIDVPKNLTEHQKELLREFQSIENRRTA